MILDVYTLTFNNLTWLYQLSILSIERKNKTKLPVIEHTLTERPTEPKDVGAWLLEY